MTQQVLLHSALCEDLEVRITEAIGAFGRNEDSFRALLMERNGLIEQLESAIASYESASAAGNALAEQAPESSPDADQQAASEDSVVEDSIASELSGGVLGIGDWEQQIETLQAEKHAELARQSETIVGLTERVEALAKEAQEAGERAQASAQSADASGQQGDLLQVQLDEWSARYEELEERAADGSAKLAAEIEELRQESTLLRDAHLTADGVAEEQLQSLQESNTELTERAEHGDQDLVDARSRIGELEESTEALQSGFDAQQAMSTELEANLAEHAAQAAEWRAGNASLTAESERLRTQLDVDTAEHETLKDELTARVGMLIAEKDHLAQTLGARELAMADLEMASSASSGERDDAERRLETLEERLGSQAKEFTELRAEMQRLVGEVEQAEQGNQTLQQEAARAGDFEQRVSELEELSREREEQLQASFTSAQALADQITGFEGRLAQAGDDRATLDATLQRQSDELDQKVSSLDDLQSAMGGLEGLVETLTATATTRDTELDQGRAQIRDLEQAQELNVDALAAVGAREAAAALQVAGLTESLTAAGVERDSISGQLSEEQATLTRLRGEHKQVRGELSDARGDLKQKVVNCRELESQLEGLGQQHKTVSDKLTARRGDLEQLKGAHSLLGDELSEARANLEQEEQRRGTVEELLTAAQSELDDVRSELGKAKGSLAARDSSFETAQDLLADLGPIFETLQSQLEKKDVLTALQSELRKPEDDA